MATKEMKAQPKPSVHTIVDNLVTRAMLAQEQFMSLSQVKIDAIVQSMALAGLANHMQLAKLAVEETGRGVYEDKITKNLFATEYIYNSIKHTKTVGVIESNPYENYKIIAEPVGIIASAIPLTNPTSTTMFKALLAMKTRNPIIFSFDSSAQQCSAEAARLMYKAAIAAGAPEHCIQWIEQPSADAMNQLMNHTRVALVLAGGNADLMKEANRTGKPAFSMGSGNVPCLIDKTANLKQAVTDLILSKTFDNGMVPASEQAVIIEDAVYDSATRMMAVLGCYFLSPDEWDAVSNIVFDTENAAAHSSIIGQSAIAIAAMAGLTVPEHTKILVAELDEPDNSFSLTAGMLCPLLACYKAATAEKGIELAARIVQYGGISPSSVVHSSDQQVIDAFTARLQTSKVIVNSPSAHGAIGDIYNTNSPSLALGFGSCGQSSATSNLSAGQLLNLKRVAERTVNMQWFKIPPKLYFEKGATQYLTKMSNINRIFIVTDERMVSLGYVDKVEYYLRKRATPVQIEVFADVEPDPSFHTVNHGGSMMDRFRPDCIIALGGGSVIDAAKAMWLFYEYPDANFDAMKMKFLDFRKRIYKNPTLGGKARFIAIPTTSGTGSEVTSFAAIIDKQKGNTKYHLTDYELTPDVAIIDPEFAYSLPRTIVADTGMDVLTHAIEAYVSVMASDYTDGMAMKAIQLVFENIEISFATGDPIAREKMHNASTIAGMAFANAFLGINHSLSHKFGAEFHIAHGRANAILLPHVIRYNAQRPSKFQAFPKYDHYKADLRYAEIARMLGLTAHTAADGVESLIEAVRKLNRALDIPDSFQAAGVNEAEFEAKVDELADRAFEDQCTTTNPRMPLVTELAQLYRDAFYGNFT